MTQLLFTGNLGCQVVLFVLSISSLKPIFSKKGFQYLKFFKLSMLLVPFTTSLSRRVVLGLYFRFVNKSCNNFDITLVFLISKL